MKEKRVTLEDIAKIAGTHVTTVSLAMRNSQRLSRDTRERIQKLAREMGYRPDPWMRALVSYRGNAKEKRNPPVLAYLTNWNSKWGWKDVVAHPEFFEGAEGAAVELGYALEHFWLREPGISHSRLSQIFKARGITGIVIASHVREYDQYLDLEWDCFSAVKIDYFPHNPILPMITNNQLGIIRMAMQKVMSQGYRRIAMVMDRGWDITVDNLWSAGFLWEQQQLPPQDRIPAYLFPNEVPLDQWIKTHRPEVIISMEDFVMPTLLRLGLKVPDDIALVDLFLKEAEGPVSGVRQNHRRVGALAVEMLASQIQYNQQGIPEVATTNHVEGTWHQGSSLPSRNIAVQELSVSAI